MLIVQKCQCVYNKSFQTNIIDVGISSTIWHIWLDRNLYIYQNKCLQANVRLDLLLYDCRTLIQNQSI